MAEIIGLLASIAGVSAAGVQISKVLYSTVRAVHGLGEEISGVAREVTILSSVFGEVSNAIQVGRNDSFQLSQSAILTIADIVKDSQSLYDKIGRAVDNEAGKSGQAKWVFRRQDVEIWGAKVSKNISLLNLMMTTLMWAETRREAIVSTVPPKISSLSQRKEKDHTSSVAPSELPARIQEQVVQSVLCVENLAKLEEWHSEGAVQIDFFAGSDLEPRHYLYEPKHGGAMRREMPDSQSLWLSELVNIGDTETLAELPGERQPDAAPNDVAISDIERATELADRLVQDWTNLTVSELTNTWEINPNQPTSVGHAIDLCRTSSPSVENLNPESSSPLSSPRILLSTFRFQIPEYNIRTNGGPIGELIHEILALADPGCLTILVPWLCDIDFPDAIFVEAFAVTVEEKNFDVESFSLTCRDTNFVIVKCEAMLQAFSQSRPCPHSMNTEDDARFYIFWNQCTAAVIRKTDPDVYLMLESRMGLAPYYPYRKVACCLALASVWSQGDWLNTDFTKSRKWARMFKLTPETSAGFHRSGHKQVNLLHAAVDYIDLHQNGVGQKVLHTPRETWGSQKRVDAVDADAVFGTRARLRRALRPRKLLTSAEPESSRFTCKMGVQEWAGIKVDSTATLFVWIGPWCFQRRVDYLPDLAEELLARRHHVQIVIIGPVEDLFGEVAALELGRLQNRYPSRLCIKTTFQSTVPRIWAGSDFYLRVCAHTPWSPLEAVVLAEGTLLVGIQPSGCPDSAGFFCAKEDVLNFNPAGTTRLQLLNDLVQVALRAIDSSPAKREEMRIAASPVYKPARLTAREVLAFCKETFDYSQLSSGYPEQKDSARANELREYITLWPQITIPTNLDGQAHTYRRLPQDKI